MYTIYLEQNPASILISLIISKSIFTDPCLLRCFKTTSFLYKDVFINGHIKQQEEGKGK